MEARTYKEIINEIRGISSGNNQLSDELKERLSKCTEEIEAKSKDSRFGLFILFVLFLGSSFMWFLSSARNDNLEIDNLNKKKLIESYEKIIRFENDSTHSFTFRTKDGNPITYQELMDENFDLMNKNSNLEYEVKTRDLYLDVIKKNYGIQVIDQDNKIWAEGAKVDSALMLLSVYRDKIKYDPQSKTWSVSR